MAQAPASGPRNQQIDPSGEVSSFVYKLTILSPRATHALEFRLFSLLSESIVFVEDSILSPAHHVKVMEKRLVSQAPISLTLMEKKEIYYWYVGFGFEAV